jgi:hypothetical protein
VRRARAPDHEQRSEPLDLVEAVPAADLPQQIRPDHEPELMARVAPGERLQQIQRPARPGELGLDPRHLDPLQILEGELAHLDAVLEALEPLVEGVREHRNHQQPLEGSRGQRVGRRHHVRDVRGIEATSEHTEARHRRTV